MRVASMTKVSRGLLNNNKFMQNALPAILRKAIRRKTKGWKVVSPFTVRSGSDSDDFAKNMISFLMEAEAYRCPRFLSKIYVPKRRLTKRYFK